MSNIKIVGLHVNDAYNVPDEQGRVLINIGHPENEEDIFVAPQIARIIKPHQVRYCRVITAPYILYSSPYFILDLYLIFKYH